MKKRIFIAFFGLMSLLTASAQLNTDRILSIGRNALYFEDYVLSIQYFNQVIKVKPYLAEPYFYRAVAKIQLEDYIGAEQDCDAVIARNPFMPQALYARGFVRMHLNKFAEAEADFSQALEFSPENVTFTLNRIEAYLQQKKYAEALSDIDALLRRNKNATELLYERGRVLFESGDTIGALKNFDNLVESDKRNADVWAARAIIRLQTDDNAGALADYNEAIRLGTRNAGYYINRGILNYEAKNYRGALADYDKAVELNPNDETALFNRSLLRAEVGDLNNAINDLTAVLEIDPNHDKAIYQRGLVYAELYDWQAAIADFSAIIERHPTFAPAYYNRADCYEKLGKKRDAFDDYAFAENLKKEAENRKTKSEDENFNTKPELAQNDLYTNKQAQFFNSNANQNGASVQSVRGSIQNTNIDVVNEKNFVLSYYQKQDLVRKGEHYNTLVSDLNAQHILPATLKLVNREMALTQALINYHFRSIDEFSRRIEAQPTNAQLYLARGIDHALTQDLSNALADFSRAIYLDSEMALAYFCRANIRCKALEFRINEQAAEDADNLILEKQFAREFEEIMQDYDQTLALAPDFAFAWFNRANVLCMQKDFRSAIRNYTNAINTDSEFAEAYFNRGLTHVYLGEIDKGIADLSKAGELGIYQAYNYLKRLRN